MADNYFLGPNNSATGGIVYDKRYFNNVQTGNFVAQTAAPVFIAPVAGRISNVWITSLTMATSTDRTATATVKKVTGTTAAAAVCSTDPAFALTATGTGSKSSLVGGTGITAAVVKTDGTATCIAGDLVTVDTAFTGSNGTIGTGFVVTVEFIPTAVLPT